MKLNRHLNWRSALVGLYMLAFAVYIFFGLQPTEATSYVKSAELLIPEIGLNTDVTALELGNDGLTTPAKIVGSYSQAENKTLLIGHSTSAFQNLNQINIGDEIYYNNKPYEVMAIDMKQKADINMNELLSQSAKDTIVLMTCAGQLLEHGDATHRLIVYASSE